MRYVVTTSIAVTIVIVALMVITASLSTDLQDKPDAFVHAAIEQMCVMTDEKTAFDVVGVLTVVTPGSSDQVLTYQAWIDGADSRQHLYMNDNLSSTTILKDYSLYTRYHESEENEWQVSGPYGPSTESSGLDLTSGFCGNSNSASYSQAFLTDFQSGELGTFNYNGDVTLDGIRVRHYTLNTEASVGSAPTPTPSVTYVLGDFTKLNPEGPYAPPIYEAVWVRPNGQLHQLHMRYDGNLP